MTNTSQSISWTASATSGSGLQVGPSSGSILVGAEKQATQQVQVTVPAGTARLRFAFTALHPDADIERLADVVRMRVLRR